MITVYLSWRSQLKGIYENSRLMLIWQSRCRIPILLVHSALVYNICFPVSFQLSLSLSLSLLSLSILLSLLTSFTIYYYFPYIMLEIYIIRQLAFYDCLLWLLIDLKENECMCQYIHKKLYINSIETKNIYIETMLHFSYLVHYPKFT
jgi:hypothetical protein